MHPLSVVFNYKLKWGGQDESGGGWTGNGGRCPPPPVNHHSALFRPRDSLTLATMKPLPISDNNVIVAHNIIDLLDQFVLFFEHGSQHWFILQDAPICRPINWGWR